MKKTFVLLMAVIIFLSFSFQTFAQDKTNGVAYVSITWIYKNGTSMWIGYKKSIKYVGQGISFNWMTYCSNILDNKTCIYRTGINNTAIIGGEIIISDDD